VLVFSSTQCALPPVLASAVLLAPEWRMFRSVDQKSLRLFVHPAIRFRPSSLQSCSRQEGGGGKPTSQVQQLPADFATDPSLQLETAVFDTIRNNNALVFFCTQMDWSDSGIHTCTALKELLLRS